jgi:hypothetical protein
MSNPIPFPAKHIEQHAASMLTLSASSEIQNAVWIDRPVPPEALGNMLQALLHKRPVAVLLLGNLVAEMLAQIDEA